jgi:hypothetical protein
MSEMRRRTPGGGVPKVKPLDLPLPIAFIDLAAERIDAETFLLRWSDALLGEMVEAEARLAQLADWQVQGGPPDSLVVLRRQPFDSAVADAEAERAGIEARRERMRDEWHGIAEGEW